MKQLFIIPIAAVSILVIGSCHEEEDFAGTPTYHVITARLEDSGTRTLLQEIPNSYNLTTKWQGHEFINVFYMMTDTYHATAPMVQVSEITDDGFGATFTYKVPPEWDKSDVYNVKLFTSPCFPKVKDGKLYYNASIIREPISQFQVPVYSEGEISAEGKLNATFHHYYTYELLHIKNTTDSDISFALLGFEEGTWFKQKGSLCIDDGSFVVDAPSTKDPVTTTSVTVKARESETIVSAYIPTGQPIQMARMVAQVNEQEVKSVNTKSSGVQLKQGRAYHMYAGWNGKELKFWTNEEEPLDVETLTAVIDPASVTGQFTGAVTNLSTVAVSSAGFRFWRDEDPEDYVEYEAMLVDDNSFALTLTYQDFLAIAGDGPVIGKYNVSAFALKPDGSRFHGNTRVFSIDSEPDPTGTPSIVDLGLPSGVKWASRNLGAVSEMGTGGYYAWGENETKGDYTWDTYAFGKPGTEEGMSKYNQDGLSDLLPEDDVIHQMYGDNWRIPTITEWEELRQECTWDEIKQDNVRIGYKITSKHNGAVLYLPACGQMDGTQVTRNDVSKYWSSSRGGSSDWSTTPQKARALFESSYGYFYRSGGDDRFLGQQIRGVLVPTPEFTSGEVVDMGLSVKWSSANLGAADRSDLGPYYAWGALEATGSYTWDTYRFGTLETGMSKYNSTDGLEYLDREDDVAWQTLGGNWRIPTREEWEELQQNCEWTQCYVNGRLGYQIVSSVNGNSIFLPLCGHMDGTRMGDGMRARYWASSRGGTSDYGGNPQKARALNEHSYGWNYRSPGDDRYLGQQIRPIYDDSFDESMLTEGEMIDMGQGVLWARCNFGSIRPEETGDYYAWGELMSKDSYSWENYKFSSDGTQSGISKYNAADGLTILTGADDVVHKELGGRWRMPTRGELADLWDNSERVVVNFNGRRGLLLTSTINGNKLFLPTRGYMNGTQLSSGMVAKYWSSDRGGSSDYNTYPQKARALNESSYGYNFRSPGDDRCLGMLIRAVYDPYVDDLSEGELIDMGLSVKWASHNLSVDQPEDVGAYYAWGETETKTDFTWETYKFSEDGAAGNHTKYNDTDAITYLDWEDDVVHKTLEGAWRMPTRSEWQELIDNCDWTEMTRNGVRGFRIKSRLTGNVIFLPSGGYYDGEGLRDGMRPRYWSNERGPTDQVSNRARALNEGRYGYNYRCDGDERRLGMPVRGVYDDSVEQTLTAGDFIDMGLSVEWASCNTGTLSPEGYGRYYGWGEIHTHSENNWANYAFSTDENGSQMTKYNAEDKKVTLELMDDAAFIFSSGTQRMPTISEWQELMENSTQVTKIKNGHLGLVLTSKINGNSMFLPLAGYRDGGQVVSSSRPHYWSSDRGGTSDYNSYPQKARALGEGAYGYNFRSPGDNRYFGMPVRGVKR